jgi:hypothetical protein
MKIGKINKIIDNVDSINATETGDPGFNVTNIINPNSLEKWQSSFASATIQINLTAGITAETISLFNIVINGTIQVKTITSADVITNSITFDSADLAGLQNKHLLFNLTEKTTPFDKIQIILETENTAQEQGVGYFAHGYGSVGYGVTKTIVASGEFSIGYVWAGDNINFGCAENMQPIDNTNDIINITRSNVPDTQVVYDYQNFNVTLKKENDFITLRENIRFFIDNGIGQPRPFILDEPYYPNPEVIYGIFDATKFGYDVIYAPGDTGDFIAQTTIGIREVF